MYDSDNAALTGFLAGRADNGNSCNNSGWGFGGGWDGLWGIIILAMIFGWGNGGWGGFGNGNNGNAQFTDAALQRGFDTQNIIGKLDGINAGLCDGFYAMNTGMLNATNNLSAAVCNLGYEQARLANATDLAVMQGNNALSTQLAQCCCDNRTGQMQIQNAIDSCCCTTNRAIEKGFADTNYNLATQICAVQTQMANNTRDIIDSNREGTQAILSYLCDRQIADLQQENQTLRLAASQEKQNNYLINALRPSPVPAYLSCNPWAANYGYGPYGFNGYGYGYNSNNGCGCNCGCNN